MQILIQDRKKIIILKEWKSILQCRSWEVQDYFALLLFFVEIFSYLCSVKQLIQYTSCPLVAFLDGCTQTTDLDLDAGSSAAPLQSTSREVEPSELLGGGLEAEWTPRSSLIRLEPLSESEASEETLFFLCELSPDAPSADSDQLDAVWVNCGPIAVLSLCRRPQVREFFEQEASQKIIFTFQTFALKSTDRRRPTFVFSLISWENFLINSWSGTWPYLQFSEVNNIFLAVSVKTCSSMSHTDV